MLQRVSTGLLLLVGATYLAPLVVAFAPERTAGLYGVVLPGDALVTLMRHRAVLLGLLGAALFYAAARSEAVVPVTIAALVSKGSFLALDCTAVVSTPEIRNVARTDTASAVALLFVLAVHFLAPRGRAAQPR